MSRPPRPYPSLPTTPTRHPGSGPLRYLPLEHADFVSLARDLHEAAFGKLPPDEEGEPTRTLYDLAASVAHVLARHQDFYASEAWLPSATQDRSLVLHARRLAYVPDPGGSAAGYAAITVNAGQSGTVSAGLGLASAPAGLRKAQDFETVEDRVVDAAWNALLPADTTEVLTVADETLTLVGTGLGLRAGAPAVLVWPGGAQALAVTTIVEDLDAGTTTLTVRETLVGATVVPWDDAAPEAGWRVYFEPSVSVRIFGATADPGSFDLDVLSDTTPTYVAPTSPYNSSTATTYGYSAPASVATDEVFLSQVVDTDLLATWMVRLGGDEPVACLVASQDTTTVVFKKGYVVQTIASVTGSGTTYTPTYAYQLAETWISGTVSRVTFDDAERDEFTVAHTLVGGWQRMAPVLSTRANTTPVDATTGLDLAEEVEGLERGMLMALSTLDGSVAQVIKLTDVTTVEVGDETRTHITWETLTDLPDDFAGWTVGDLQVLGNVARIAHGATKVETLGTSDGVTPFQRYALKKTPLAHDVTGENATPAVAVTVGDVTWTRVADFADSLPTDRHFKVEVDSDGVAWVCFGDGRLGAVPPAGKRNVVATYRVGLGEDGNVEAGAASRLAKAHPLVQRARNPVALAGGTEPADPSVVRTAATRYIRTFDRAVSVQDHADLALRFSGVARAAASWDDTRGVVLVAATSAGEPVSDLTAFRTWLDARRDTSVRLTLLAPDDVFVYLGLYVEPEEGYELRDVEDAVRAALAGDGGLLTFGARSLGQALHLAEVYEVLHAVEGLAYVEVTQLALDPAAVGTVAAVIRVHTNQWLAADGNTITFTTGGS